MTVILFGFTDAVSNTGVLVFDTEAKFRFNIVLRNR